MDDPKLSRRRILAVSGAAALTAACKTIPPRACCTVNEPEAFAPGPPEHPDPPLPGIPVERRRLWAFDEIHHADANVYRPATVAALVEVVKVAARQGQRITVRGGGKSLGEQSLGGSVVFIDAPAFQHIGDVRHEDGELLLTCGSGARWGDVVRKISDQGFVPRSVVTTGDATVGGTSVVDGVSRMAPLVGKEGQQIKSITLIDGTGTLRTFDDRVMSDGKTKTPEFRAAITSFGALGVVTEVTFRVARAIPRYHRRPDVETVGSRWMPGTYDWGNLLRSITKQAADWAKGARSYYKAAALDQPVAENGGSAIIGMSVVCWFHGEGYAVDRLIHRYVHDEPGERIPGGLYTEGSLTAEIGERIAGYSDTLTQAASSAFFPDGTYVDELCGFLFFLGNGTVPAIKAVRKLGARLNFVQQTYVVPTPLLATGEYDVDRTRQFMELCLARCRERNVHPFSVDLLHLQGDDGLLSATRDLTGYAITVTFADHDAEQWPYIQRVFKALSHDLYGLGGRVHLVKNVELDPSDLQGMYGPGFKLWKQVKDQLDPKNIFGSAFYERYFARWSPS